MPRASPIDRARASASNPSINASSGRPAIESATPSESDVWANLVIVRLELDAYATENTERVTDVTAAEPRERSQARDGEWALARRLEASDPALEREVVGTEQRVLGELDLRDRGGLRVVTHDGVELRHLLDSGTTGGDLRQ